jgi:two-component system sensor histidine kinase/response regulator
MADGGRTARLSDVRYIATGALLVLFAMYTISVIEESQRLQGELHTRMTWLSDLSTVQRTLQTNHPTSPELPASLEKLDGTLKQVESAVPKLFGKARAVRLASVNLLESLEVQGRRTQARTQLFVAIDDLTVGLRGLNRDLSSQLAKQWTAIQTIAMGASGLATAMLVLLIVVRARGRLAVRMRIQVEEALAATEAARRAEARASAAKSDFLATVSHEIRTPMTAILGTAELLSGTPLRPAQEDHLEVIRSGGEALLRLINDVLDLSRFESGHIDISLAPFDVEGMLDGVVLLFAAAAEEKGITLSAISGSNVPRSLVADENRIQQVLVNLVGNAVKFTKAGHVVVRIEFEPKRLRCVVEDTGPGLKADDATRVFAAFEQVDSSRARSHGGTGLGLAISERLVDAMGGSIGVDSTLGLGSRFHFELPVTGAGEPPRVDVSPYVVVGPPEKTVFAMEQMAAWGLSGEAMAAIPPSTPLGGRRVLHLGPLGADGGDVMDYRPNLLPGPVRPRGLRRAWAGAPAMSGSIRLTDPTITDLSEARGRLLVVDDNETNRRVIGSLLERLGYTVDRASGGRAALELAARIPYDLVFMDCDMPLMDGLETTEALRASGGAWATIPVVGLSGHAGEDARERGLDSGMTDYLAKPVRIRTLEATLDRLLGGAERTQV